MAISLLEQQCDIPVLRGHKDLLAHFQRQCLQHVGQDWLPIRFAVTSADPSVYHCEFATIALGVTAARPRLDSIFELRLRRTEVIEKFNVVFLVPTGIGAELGGHAGDAGPVARLLAEVSDTLVLHPNVVNASDINEMPANALYVEGSVITRLLLGTAGLLPVRSNRVLVVIDAHRDEFFINAAVNAVSGARTSYGLSCSDVVCLERPVKLLSGYSPSGRSAGRIEELDDLCRLLEERSGQYDAVALSSVISVPPDYHQGYFDSGGDMVNPWGGVEAMLTHALSSMFDVPTAHSPMFESREIANRDPGIVDPRMAAEAVSTTFLQCTLKGLQRSPRIITDTQEMQALSVLTASDVSCLVIPDGCLGIPTLAALEQGIPVVAVANKNLMANDLAALPWADGQFHRVDNYCEAVGVLAAIRAGIACDSVRRPIAPTRVSYSQADSNAPIGVAQGNVEHGIGQPIVAVEGRDVRAAGVKDHGDG